MPHELQDLVRIRELRARLAQLEAVRLRQELLRAEIAVADAKRVKANHEANIDQASGVWESPRTAGGRNAGGNGAATNHGPENGAMQVFSAAQAHERIAFVAGERIQVRHAEVQVRRAKLVQRQVEEESNDASKTYRELLLRRETLIQELKRQTRKRQLLRLERDDQSIAEDRAMSASVQRAHSGTDASDDEP